MFVLVNVKRNNNKEEVNVIRDEAVLFVDT